MTDKQINLHLVDTSVDRDERVVPNVHSGNLIATDENALRAAGGILDALSNLQDDEALVIWRGNHPL